MAANAATHKHEFTIMPKRKKTEPKKDKPEKPKAELPPSLQPKKIGRPSKYDPSYCELVVDLGAAGKSKAQIAAAIGVTRTTMDSWAEKFPEFLGALKAAKDLELAWWESAGQFNMVRQGFNATAFIFQMKNRFRDDYRDVSVNEHTGKDGGPIQTQDAPRSTGEDHLQGLAQRFAGGLKVINGGKPKA